MNRLHHEQVYNFNQTHSSVEAAQLAADQERVHVSVTGRLLNIRDQGSLIFADMHDDKGEIQIVAQPESTEAFDDFQQLAVGDYVGVSGTADKTRRGEPSIFVSDWIRLATSQEPFPGKNGIEDPNIIYRQRYLDLATNPESMRRFVQRSKILSSIRRILEDQNFIEVETPILQPIYGGASAEPFSTHHNALDMPLYLRVAPELYLKRLVVGGMQRVFEIGKNFRNEGTSSRHNPEFSAIEVYAANWDYRNQMELTENLVAGLAQQLHGTTKISYAGKEVDLTTPWPRITMDQLVSESTGVEVSQDTDISVLRSLCDTHDVPYKPTYGPGKLLQELYEKLNEPNIWNPVFVTDYPEEVSPLARTHRSRPGYTERFETVAVGRELANGYTELNDPAIQYSRFKDQEATQVDDSEAMRMDHDYVRALRFGLPPTAGLGIGIDRLVMLLTDAQTIKDVLLFPLQRPDGYTAPYSS